MSNFKIEIQIPSGALIDVTPTNAMPIIRGLLHGTNYVPELVTTLWISVKTEDNRTIQVLLSPIDDFKPIVDSVDS